MSFLDGLKKNLTDVSENVVKKSGEVVETQKLKLKKASLEADLDCAYAEIGRLYFEKYAQGAVPEDIQESCDKVTACQQAIDEIADRIAQVKGIVICPNCQAEVDKTASFCPKCGKEIIQIVESQDDEIKDAVKEDIFEPHDVEEEKDILEEDETAAEETEGAETSSEEE